MGETLVDSIVIKLSNPTGNELLYLGSVYIGTYKTLPRFITEPEFGYEMLTSSKRTFGGFAYGLDGDSLRNFSAEFRRINKIDFLKVKDYALAVGQTIPHFIDFYSEANDICPIMYCTLDDDLSATKRPENDFYFDFSLEWKEAK